MADEEQAMQELYGKQGGGGTPGANKLWKGKWIQKYAKLMLD